jgi:nicotinamidase-related amidase
MPVTKLDAKTALVVIDLQKGIVSANTAHPSATIVKNSAMLAAAFRAAKKPVILVNVTGGAPGRVEQARPTTGRPPDWSELVTELGQQPSDHTITKRTWGAFTNTELLALLQRLGVTQIVLCGISTSIGVESTARQAFEFGFNVTLAIDAMTDLNLDAHTNSLTRIFPRLGETGTTQEIIARLSA